MGKKMKSLDKQPNKSNLHEAVSLFCLHCSDLDIVSGLGPPYGLLATLY